LREVAEFGKNSKDFQLLSREFWRNIAKMSVENIGTASPRSLFHAQGRFMKPFFGVLIVCILVVAVVMFEDWLHKTRSKVRALETEVALNTVATYRELSSFQRDWTLYYAPQAFKFLTNCLDPNSHMVFSSSELNSKVEAARCLAVTNLVAWLETNSGMSYGTNAQTWEDWLKAHPPEVKAGSVK